ncbi:hypothetical protein AVEN_24581-1 [Araneus ventricosus]|uniref:Uncharacterized protein n=1 Tax=Araneus ventricosus TaxID=182803 RepID=A0A4Y2FDX3_ARAVE|nr:hypothetical protein AVEN_24581-1 [Araneus ventricosus]
MTGRFDGSTKCELDSVIRFLQAQGWFMKDSSCFLSDFRKTAKSHSGFWSCLHSDNACSHSAVVTYQLLEQFKWDVSEHQAYSFDLVTSDFHLFPELKS